MAIDRWIRAAMSDDMLVVELLVHLKQSQASSTFKSSYPSTVTSMLPLRWSLRLPRSRAIRCDAVSQVKKSDSARCSPTTPLSWSAGASPSATADGFEESSRPRSKGNTTIESASTATTIAERSRPKKKTFAELKEEESSLLKERTYLEKELVTLRATFKEQRANNVSLKRIKLDLNFHSEKSLDVSSCGPETNQWHYRAMSTVKKISSSLCTETTHDDHSQKNSSEASEVVPNRDSYLLPDLNMVPSELDHGSEMLCEMH